MQEYVPPNSVFEEADWVRVNANQIKRLLDVFDTDTNVQTAFRVRMNSVLSGGVRVERRYHSMSQWNSRLFSNYLCDMANKVYRLKWAIGFAAVTFIPHPLLGWVPKVLDMNDRIEVLMKPFADGRPTLYRWYELTDKLSNVVSTPGVNTPNRVLIKNVITLVESEPAIDGTIRSVTSILDRGYHLEEVLLMCCEDAYPRMAIPSIVTEKPDEKLDPDNLRNPIDPSLSPSIQKTLDQLVKRTSNHSTSTSCGDEPQFRVSSNAIVINRLINSRGVFQSEDRQSQETQARWERMARTRNDVGPQLWLQDGRKLARQLESKAPDKIYLDYVMLRKRTVCELFSCPYSMLSSEGAKSGNSSNTMKVFSDAQKTLEQQIINDLHLVYSWVYSRGDVASFFDSKADQLKSAKKRNDLKRKARDIDNDNDPDKRARTDERAEEQEEEEEEEPEEWQMNEHELRVFTEVKFTLPALPEFAVMRQLWMDGMLKYDCFTRYCSALFSVNEQDWNTKPTPPITAILGSSGGAKQKEEMLKLPGGLGQ